MLSGIDGSGKSTQAALLSEWLRRVKEKETLLTAEPSQGTIGELIKSALKKELDLTSRCLQLLFAADREDHLNRLIEPALSDGKTVVCDRYVLSSLAYGSLDMDLNYLIQLNSKFRIPDLTLIFDTPVKICMERLKKGRHLEIFENRQMLEKVRENYLMLAKSYPNAVVIKGDLTELDLARETRWIVMEKLYIA